MRHHRCRPGVALRADELRERLVRDLTHDVAPEAPVAAVELDQPVIGEAFQVVLVEVLLHLGRELRECVDRATGAEHGGIVDDQPLRRREPIETSGDQCSQRTRQRRARRIRLGQLGEFGEKQGIAATALVQLVDQRVRRDLTDDRGHQPRRLATFERVERHPHRDRVIDRRGPFEVGVVALRRDDQQRSIGERPRDPVQQFDDQDVGPLQVVDPQHHRTVCRASANSVDDVREQRTRATAPEGCGRGRRGTPSGATCPRRTDPAADRSTRTRRDRPPCCAAGRVAGRAGPRTARSRRRNSAVAIGDHTLFSP